MAESKKPGENEAERRQEALPGTDFYESEVRERDRVRGEKIGSTFDKSRGEKGGPTPDKQAE
jgi:hypothetical protein